jgi:NTP pyrophosphatase (non-canonical NTP hydrolase)
MNSKQKEVMLIAQEECAEVIQAISKVFRFGVTDKYNGQTNKERLEEETGDLLCMIDLMIEEGMIDIDRVLQAKDQKNTKLRTWSDVFKEEKVLQNA